jgi:hypothetical protein
VTIDEVAHHLRINHCSAHGPSKTDLGLTKFVKVGSPTSGCRPVGIVRKRTKATEYSYWVPKQLTEEHKHNRLKICQGLLIRYRSKRDASLGRRRDVDPSVHARKQIQPVKKKFKTQLSAVKVKLPLFYGIPKGQFWNDAERGTTL